jgi:COMPASS component SWD2
MSSSAWNPSNISINAVIYGDANVTNLDFHKAGRMMLMGTANNTLSLVDCLTGQEKKKIHTKTFGLGTCVKYTHHESCVLCTSDKKTNDIRYLCTYDNKYLRYFKGHTDKVTALQMSPIDDCFLSISRDRTMLLWNLSTPNYLAKLSLPMDTADPCVCYDESGIVFAVMSRYGNNKSNCIKLYDSRNYEKGPFADITPSKSNLGSSLVQLPLALSDRKINEILSDTWSSIEFSPDGRNVLVNTSSSCCFLLDSYDSNTSPVVISSLPVDSQETTTTILSSTFSADGNYILCGTSNGTIMIFDRYSGSLVNTLSGHVSPVTHVRCNPIFDVVASACVNVALWSNCTSS